MITTRTLRPRQARDDQVVGVVDQLARVVVVRCARTVEDDPAPQLLVQVRGRADVLGEAGAPFRDGLAGVLDDDRERFAAVEAEDLVADLGHGVALAPRAVRPRAGLAEAVGDDVAAVHRVRIWPRSSA